MKRDACICPREASSGGTRTFIFVVMLIASVLLLNSGCARAPTHVDSPRVTLAGIWLVGVNLLEQRYQIQLRIQNPNPFNLAIAGMEYDLEINDQVFARGVSNRHVTIARYSMELVSVEAVSTLTDVMRQLDLRDQHMQNTLRYRIKGTLNLRNRATDLPFEYRGEITLPAWMRNARI